MFGTGADPDLPECAVCGIRVELANKMMADRETIHKECFFCCFCGNKLQPGAAAMELSFFNRYGPRWYCSGSAGRCALIPVAEKDAKLKEKGLAQKKYKKAKK